ILRRFEAELRGAGAPNATRSSTRAAPLSDAERALAAIWREVLGREDVSTHHGFLELGGNSLHAMQIVARIHEALGVELPLRALFEGGSIERVARLVEEAKQAGAGGPTASPGTPGLHRDSAAREHPLSFVQQRMWVLQQLAPESRAYNEAGALELDGPLDADL